METDVGMEWGLDRLKGRARVTLVSHFLKREICILYFVA